MAKRTSGRGVGDLNQSPAKTSIALAHEMPIRHTRPLLRPQIPRSEIKSYQENEINSDHRMMFVLLDTSNKCIQIAPHKSKSAKHAALGAGHLEQQRSCSQGFPPWTKFLKMENPENIQI